MRIKLSGGRMDGTMIEVSDRMSVVSFPLLSLRDNVATTASDNEIKRHSWDNEALNISYLDYHRSDMEADDGTVIFTTSRHYWLSRPHRFASISEQQWKVGKSRHLCALCDLDYSHPIHGE
jgi:hypothetical protein